MQRPKLPPPLTFAAFLFIVAAIFNTDTMFGQCNDDQTPETYVQQIDGNGDPIPGTFIPPSKIMAGYAFEMPFDSCSVLYRVADVLKNGNRIKLLDWCRGQVVTDLDIQQMQDSSRTEAFTISAGDTISFFRDIAWYNPFTVEQTQENFYSEDTLAFVVELVNATTGNRLMMLDSLGVLRQIPSGPPSLHGSRPVMDVVKYVIPPAFSGLSAQMRIRLYAKGDGAYFFVRRDSWGYALSERLTRDIWQKYNAAFSGSMGLPKSSLEDAPTSSEYGELTVTPNPSAGDIDITFKALGKPVSGESVSIAIYNAAGSLVLVPTVVQSDAMIEQTVRTTLFESGTYFVALRRDGRPVAVRRVVVSR